MSDFIETTLFTTSRKAKYIRIFLGLLAITSIGIIIFSNEINKRETDKTRIKIEQERIQTIDKKLSLMYEKLYKEASGTDSSKIKGLGLISKQIIQDAEFLKKQRIDAEKAIDEINKKPDSYSLIFATIISVIASFIAMFFTNIFNEQSKATITTSHHSYIDNDKKPEKQQEKNIVHSQNGSFDETLLEFLAYSGDVDKYKYYKNTYEGLVNKENQKKVESLITELMDNDLNEDEIEEDINPIYNKFEDLKSRLVTESNRLNKQAIINLLLCFFIAIAFLGIVLYGILFNQNSEKISWEVFIIQYIPKLTGILGLLTMFLYFTKLYKTNILDAKYYQNEATNVEFRFIALMTCFERNKRDSQENEIILGLSNFDRNNVISNEQTSLELERLKVENELNKNYLTQIWDLKSFFSNKKENP